MESRFKFSKQTLGLVTHSTLRRRIYIYKILQACVTDDRLVDMQTKRHCQDSNEKLQFRISIANVLLRTSKHYVVLIPGVAIV
jgi:hypothetical protein